MIDPGWMLRLTCASLGLWGLLNASLWWMDRRAWRAGRALGWDLFGSRRGRLAGSPILARVFSRRPFELLIAMKFVVSLLLLLLPISGWTPRYFSTTSNKNRSKRPALVHKRVNFADNSLVTGKSNLRPVLGRLRTAPFVQLSENQFPTGSAQTWVPAWVWRGWWLRPFSPSSLRSA